VSSTAAAGGVVVEEGVASFSIESRILRELGERLVKQPEVALLELIKNAYDADSPGCQIVLGADEISVSDTGDGMTIDQFNRGWMRIGTSSKEELILSRRYHRLITGEKGIGRFAVRFLGQHLQLVSVAYDEKRQSKTRLTATFDWPLIDSTEALGDVQVPYSLETIDDDAPTGVTLTISKLRRGVSSMNLSVVRTGSIGVLTPLRPLLRPADPDPKADRVRAQDPGFALSITPSPTDDDDGDVASEILDAYVLRAVLELTGDRLSLQVYKRGQSQPYASVVDTYANEIGRAYADIRFLPRRKGTFTGLNVDGRKAASWVADNAGVAVFDRTFRVYPYGTPKDDWLTLAADTARNYRLPRSPIAQKHFPMDAATQASTAENYMLRLPSSSQLVGVVQVEGRRSLEQGDQEGLIASADREGFLENLALSQLVDVVRGAIEVIAYCDRNLQREEDDRLRQQQLAQIREQTREAIESLEANAAIAPEDRSRLVAVLAQTSRLAQEQDDSARERERQLEVMSLLGVVAGFMTHEFGVALHELKDTQKELDALAADNDRFAATAKSFGSHIDKLEEFVAYSQAYIHGSRISPNKPYKVRPRLGQVLKIYGAYAEARGIDVEVEAEEALLAPLVPASLYNGIALNLYTNALKAVTAKSGPGERRIAFRAWNEGKTHVLEVADTGIGVPSVLRERVFDPLFTTTASSSDPLGSGMGLGLALVRRGVAAFGGKADLVDPPPGFATCVRIRLPLNFDI
jgi:signal transduction histidine kinase